MALRKSHGSMRDGGPVRVEVLPADELPCGVQAPTQVSAGGERDEHGRFRKGARTSQAAGGRATKHRTRLAAQLGLADLAEAADFAPYLEAAHDFAKHEGAYLAAQIGGGEIGPDVGAIILTAAWQVAASRYLFERGVREGDPQLFAQASRLGDSSRQNLLAARELAAKGAQSRKQPRGGVHALVARTQQDRSRERPNPTPTARDASAPRDREES
jgi:hypothetical protein